MDGIRAFSLKDVKFFIETSSGFDTEERMEALEGLDEIQREILSIEEVAQLMEKDVFETFIESFEIAKC